MNAPQAEKLVRAYVDGWRENNLAGILGTLVPDCLIIESHGPTYRGAARVRQWVMSWFAEGSIVDRWDITAFCSVGSLAAFEWEFECTVAGQHYRIDGASVAEFAGGKIAALREYRRTEPPYEWQPA